MVSLVPSLTETIHDLGLGGSLVGVTRFCVRPHDARLTARTVGGTKDPDLGLIRSLKPDLLLADEDENKPEHIEELRSAVPRVHATRIERVDDVARELRAIGALVGRTYEAEKYASEIQEAAANLRGASRVLRAIPAFVPIWKRPLMSLGGRTYMSDLLSLSGGRNIFGEAKKKYFEADADEVRSLKPDLILLPTEPYRFREADRADFSQRFDLPLDSVRIVDGQAFTWFGTHTKRGLRVLPEAVALARSSLAQGS